MLDYIIFGIVDNGVMILGAFTAWKWSGICRAASGSVQ